jgi:hypothetical protein
VKQYEEKLLKTLKSNSSQDIPLANIKKALGSISYAPGNPLTKTEISITISLIYALQGAGIQLPGAFPAAAQLPIPVWLFGLTDFYSGYPKLETIISPLGTWVRSDVPTVSNVPVGIYGYTFTPFDAFIRPFLQVGDMVLAYRFNPGGFYVLVVIHCNNVTYGTFLNSFISDLITISTIRYIVNAVDILQFTNPLRFGTQSLFGKVKTDNIDPRTYILSTKPQQQIADIPINLPIDKSLMFGFYMNWGCNPINFVLFVEKIEALTHRSFK